MRPDSVFAPGLSRRQRWNRFKWNVLRIRPVIVMDSNPVSISAYVLHMDDKYGDGWLGASTKQVCHRCDVVVNVAGKTKWTHGEGCQFPYGGKCDGAPFCKGGGGP